MSSTANAQAKRLLTSKGYAVLKSSLSAEAEARIQKELTMTPRTNTKFVGAKAAAFPIYFESSTRYYLPRHWARAQFGREEGTTLPEGAPLPPTAAFTGKPFDYQEAIIQSFFDAGGEGLVCVPCGKGKTFMALAIAARVGRRFLVVVDKEFFLEQWRAEMGRFFPGLRVGILQGDRCETDAARWDCTIVMIQTLVQRPFPTETFAGYGLAIFDECHHLGAAQFSQSLAKIQMRHMLGLSATPEREDGMEDVFHHHIGPPVYRERTREQDDGVQVRVIQYRTTDTSYSEEPTDWRGEVVMAKLLGQVVEHEERTQMVAEVVRRIKQENAAYNILILSERKVMLERLEQLLGGLKGSTVGWYVGGMKDKDREKTAAEADIILGTYSMAQEGLNIPKLSCCILASPRKRVEQSVGRILRQKKEERKCAPLIVDVVDMHGLYQGQYRKRAKLYKECGYRMYAQDFEAGEFSELREVKARAKAGAKAGAKGKAALDSDSEDEKKKAGPQIADDSDDE
jgi:superfamily II DNA or RNA helicase